MADLYEITVSLRQRSSSGSHFISYPSLRHAIDRPLVAASVDGFCSQQPHRRAHVTDTIRANGLKVFAILVLLRQESFILDFIEALGDGIDNGLPYEQSRIDRISREISSRSCSEVQWELIPHTFQYGGFHRRISEQVILPYTAERRFDEGSGGEIFECTLASGQHNFASGEASSNTPLKVIKKRIKMLKSNNESKAQAFEKELECLEILRCIRHANIIELLSSYQQHEDYFLLFPRLSMNLADFLALETRHGYFKDDLAFFNALRGLSSAVTELHELSLANEELVLNRIGYHHDIKPKNVLVTENTFVLTDFGLARLCLPDEGSQSQWVNTIGDYIAPECMDDDFNRKVVGRSIDVWALGCLIADVATCMELGRDGVQRYRQKRKETIWPQVPKNYRFFEKDALRSSVIDWLNDMYDDCKVPGLSFLIEIVASTLQVDPEARPKVSEVHQRLQYISAKMLYRRVVLARENRQKILLGSSDRISSYAQMDSWFDFEKLRAWGNVLGMESESTDHDLFLHQPTVATTIHDILQNHIQTNSIDSNVFSERPLAANPSSHDREFVKQLWETLPNAYQMLIEQTWRRNSINTDDLPRLIVIEQAARILPSPYSQIARDAALKRLSLKIWQEHAQTNNNSPSQQTLLIKRHQLVRDLTISDMHETGWLDQRSHTPTAPTRLRVFIEWVIFAPTWEKQSSEEKILKILGLAEMLSSPKPDTLRVLDCVGVVPPAEDPNHPGFGYVYKLPSHHHPRDDDNNESTRPSTLTDILQGKVALEHRFWIASRLCTSLYHLHSAGWLHKNLKANNILFFTDRAFGGVKNASPPAKLDPYIVGFQHSRPNGDVWQSDYDVYSGLPSDYRHPEYNPVKTKFRLTFDYYSLGVLLLEIGFWLPISSFRAQHRNMSKYEFRDLLVVRYAPQISLKMGSVYAGIVLKCLEGRFGEEAEAEANEGNEVIDQFFWGVVAPIIEMRIW